MISKAQERLYKVLFGPHVTEKAVSGNESNTHVFKVATTATKGEIKTAVETLFEVEVADVRSVNVKGKSKNFGKRKGSRKRLEKSLCQIGRRFYS